MEKSTTIFCFTGPMVVTTVIALAPLLWIKYYEILPHWAYGSNEGYSLSLSLMEKVLIFFTGSMAVTKIIA